MKSELKKKKYVDPGSLGLPGSYPSPPLEDDLLFYIQRNQNKDTIVYELNRSSGGRINEDLPMHAYWIKYSEGGVHSELNEIQNKLAYGYESEMINEDLFRFNFIVRKELDFYIAKDSKSKFNVLYKLDGRWVRLNNIYVYAVEFGVFPDVKFIELYGEEQGTGVFTYDKINVE